MTTETTMYRVTASYERDGMLLDASQAEVLGDAYGIMYPTQAEAEAVAAELQGGLAMYDLDPTTTYSVEEAPRGWGRLTDTYIRDMIHAVEHTRGVIHDGSDSIGVCVREYLQRDPSATAAEIAAEIIEAQDDAAAERARG